MRAGKLLFVGLVVTLTACGTPEAPKPQDSQKMPVVPAIVSAAPIIDAKVIFDRNCVSCHGSKGKGDGPASAGMANKPANLTSPLMRERSDAELLKAIAEGKLEKGMPPWKSMLSQEEIRELVNYIRSLGKK